MREIKFRGKSKGENKWVYGSILTNKDGTEPRICVQTIERDLVTENILKFVHPNTVGQFTGKRDSKGTDIYEGDIIEYLSSGKYYEVLWDAEYGRWACRRLGDDNMDRLRPQDFLVVGNIHQKSNEILTAELNYKLKKYFYES